MLSGLSTRTRPGWGGGRPLPGSTEQPGLALEPLGSSECPDSARRLDGAVQAPVTSSGGWGVAAARGGGGWVPAASPHTSQQRITSLPTTMPSTRHTRHGAGRGTRPRVTSGSSTSRSQGVAATRRVWRGIRSLHAARALPCWTRGQPGPAALGGQAGL